MKKGGFRAPEFPEPLSLRTDRATKNFLAGLADAAGRPEGTLARQLLLAGIDRWRRKHGAAAYQQHHDAGRALRQQRRTKGEPMPELDIPPESTLIGTTALSAGIGQTGGGVVTLGPVPNGRTWTITQLWAGTSHDAQNGPVPRVEIHHRGADGDTGWSLDYDGSSHHQRPATARQMSAGETLVATWTGVATGDPAYMDGAGAFLAIEHTEESR